MKTDNDAPLELPQLSVMPVTVWRANRAARPKPRRGEWRIAEVSVSRIRGYLEVEAIVQRKQQNGSRLKRGLGMVDEEVDRDGSGAD